MKKIRNVACGCIFVFLLGAILGGIVVVIMTRILRAKIHAKAS